MVASDYLQLMLISTKSSFGREIYHKYMFEGKLHMLKADVTV